MPLNEIQIGTGAIRGKKKNDVATLFCTFHDPSPLCLQLVIEGHKIDKKILR